MATPALVQSTQGLNGSGSNANLFTSNFPAACTAGNTLVVFVCVDAANASLTSITDNASSHNTYTLLDSYTDGTLLTIFAYAATNITANAGAVYQVQATDNFVDGQIFAQEWSNLTATKDGTTVKNTGTSAPGTISGTALTTTNATDAVFNLTMLGLQTNTWTVGSGWSNMLTQASSFTSAAVQSRVTSTTGSFTGSYGMTDNGDKYDMMTFALKATGSVAAVKPSLMMMGVGS